MARAHTIWIVIYNMTPWAAFTVKHECRTFLKRKMKDEHFSIHKTFVVPLRDGSELPLKWTSSGISVEDFLKT